MDAVRRRGHTRTRVAEDAEARIDLVSSAEDRVRKAKEYAAELAKARAEGMDSSTSARQTRDDEDATKADAAEEATRAKTTTFVPPKKREVKVQILTRDQTYNPFDDDEKAVGFETDEATYRPSVSTWGVFERPDNISKAYGGGRTIKREELEDETAIAERKARVAKKLAKYREDNGMTMTPEEFQEAKEALDEAEAAIKAGYMQAALDRLEIIALEKVGPKTELGGRIIFNYALCLDNLQRRDEALKQYRRCIGNQYGNVSKQADRMVWGMTTASRKMKSDLFDYIDAAKLDAYDEYLIKMANNKFGGDIDEEEERQLQSTAVSTMVVLFGAPLVLLAFLMSRQ
jgi:tetratricopeptide (TPR) repeat protein